MKTLNVFAQMSALIILKKQDVKWSNTNKCYYVLCTKQIMNKFAPPCLAFYKIKIFEPASPGTDLLSILYVVEKV
jgi:hypothetical protein